MPGQKLGGGMNDDVGPPLDGAAQIGGGQGIVDDQRNPGIVGHFGHRLDIHHHSAGIGQGLDENRLGRGADGGLKIGRIGRIDKAAMPAQLLERQTELGQRTAIQIARGDEMIPRFQQSEKSQELGGMTRRGAHRRPSAFQSCYPFFQHADRGIGQTRINMAEAVQIEQGCRLFHIVEHVGTGLIDGRDPRPRRGIGLRPRMHRLGGEAEGMNRAGVFRLGRFEARTRRLLGSAGNDAGIDPIPSQLAAQPTKFDLGAAIHHHIQTGGQSPLGGCVVAHPQLHPDHLGMNGDGVVHDRLRRLGIAEHLHHIHRHRNGRQVRINRFAQQLLTRQTGIDRNHPIAFVLQVFHDEIGWPVPIGRGPDQGDHLDLLQNAPQKCVRIGQGRGLVRHFFKYSR